MKNTFENFFQEFDGIKIIDLFNEYKAEIENPVLLIRKSVGKIGPKYYLDIGGGDGKKTVEMTKILKPERVDFLEPSVTACRAFSSIAKKENIKFKTICKRFEDFIPEEKYDFITSIHSWYYIRLNSLDKLYRILNPGGVACIFIDSKNDTIKKIQDLCEKELGIKSNNSEDICNYLKSKKIKYSVIIKKNKIHGLINKGEFTEKAYIIMSVISWKSFNLIDEKTKDSVKSILKSKRSLPIERHLIVIKKPFQ